MTPFEQILKYLVATWRVDFLILGKIGMLILFGLFFVFSLVVLRQIDLMKKTIHTELDQPLKLAAYFLVGLAGAAFVLGLWIL